MGVSTKPCRKERGLHAPISAHLRSGAFGVSSQSERMRATVSSVISPEAALRQRKCLPGLERPIDPRVDRRAVRHDVTAVVAARSADRGRQAYVVANHEIA